MRGRTLSRNPGERTLRRAAAHPPSARDDGDPDELRRRIDALQEEREELWKWVYQMERLARAGLLAGGVAHDMGNLFTSLMAGSELALLKDEPTGYRESVIRNLDLSRRAAEALRTFAAFARDDDEAPQSVVVSETAEDALRVLAHPLRKRNVTVVQRYEGHDVAWCRKSRLREAVVSLLLRALESLGNTGGTIELRVRRVGNEVHVEVHDDGPGFPDAHPGDLFRRPRGKIRHPIHRPRPGSATWITASPLVLFLTRRSIEDMGGRIDHWSMRGGTVIRIAIPASQP